MRKHPLMVEVGYVRSKSITVALTALRYLVEYGRACDAMGGEIDINEYAEHVGVKHAQAYRRRGAFEKCYPGNDALEMWRGWVRDELTGSPFEHATSQAAAVYVGSMVATMKKPG